MKLITLVLVATFLTLSSLCVQGSPEDGLSRWKDQSVQQPADDPLLRWMNKIAQQELQARENAIAQIRTVSDAERRKTGGSPGHPRWPERGPLLYLGRETSSRLPAQPA